MTFSSINHSRNMKQKTVLWAFFAFIILLCVFVLIDISAYASSRDKLRQSVDRSEIERSSKRISADLDKFKECYRHQGYAPGPADFGYNEKLRACILYGLERVESAAGAISFANMAGHYLKSHPDDQQMRAAALLAIKKGRMDALNSKHMIEDPLLRVAKEHDKSFVLRALNGEYADEKTSFDVQAKALSDAEFFVLQPDAYLEQLMWYKSAIAKN